MSHFDVLGVHENASDNEIQSAYRSLARQLHPDQHPGASAEEQRRLHDAMARVNAAYSAISDPEQRRMHRNSLRNEEARSNLRPPRVGECLLCGHSPASELRFMYQNAWVIRATRYTSEVELCRSCGLSYGRSHLNRTLWTGWWGILSFFTNLWVVGTNVVNLRRARTLDDPKAVPNVVAPLPHPMPAGKPMHRRSGPWLALAMILMLVIAVATSEEDTGSSYGGTFTPSSSDVGWRVGSCVEGYSLLSPTSCAGPHTGKIVDSTFTPDACPLTSESYVEDGATVWCIDDDL